MSACLMSSVLLIIPVFLNDVMPHSVSGCLVSDVWACLTSVSNYSAPKTKYNYYFFAIRSK